MVLTQALSPSTQIIPNSRGLSLGALSLRSLRLGAHVGLALLHLSFLAISPSSHRIRSIQLPLTPLLESHGRSVPMNWASHPTIRHATRSQQEAWRTSVLARDRYCRIQGADCTSIATEADHIVNVAEGGAELDLANGQGACANCHEQKTQQEATRGKNRWKRKPERHPGLR